MTDTEDLIDYVGDALRLQRALESAGLGEFHRHRIIESPQVAKFVVKTLDLCQELLAEPDGPQTEVRSLHPLTDFSDPILGYTYWRKLRSNWVRTVADASLCMEEELLSIKSIGPKRFDELAEIVARAGLEFLDSKENFWEKATKTYGSFGEIPAIYLVHELESFRESVHYLNRSDWVGLFDLNAVMKDIAEDDFKALHKLSARGSGKKKYLSAKEIAHLKNFLEVHLDTPF